MHSDSGDDQCTASSTTRTASPSTRGAISGVFRECVSDDGRSLAVRGDVECDFCTRSEPLGAALGEVRVDVPEEEQ